MGRITKILIFTMICFSFMNGCDIPMVQEIINYKSGNDINVRQGLTALPNGAGNFPFGNMYADGNSGEASAYLDFTIDNLGKTPLTINSITIGGINPADFDLVNSAVSPVAPGGSTAFSLRFDPLTTGNKTATVTITNDDADEGAYKFNLSGSGTVRSDWVMPNKLLQDTVYANDYYGYAIAISGTYAIFGARLDDDKGANAGAAYICDRSETTWYQGAKLLAGDGAAGDLFGSAVSISGNYAIVGAPNDDDKGGDSGSAYVFYYDYYVWSLQAKLTASDGAAGHYFGCSVSISGDYAVVGASYDDDNGTNSGSAYVFYRSGATWTQQAKLVASDGGIHDHFGNSVSISSDYAVVGAYNDDDLGSDSGSAYVFFYNGGSWTQQAKLTAGDGAEADHFGSAVSVSGSRVLVGAEGAGFGGCAYIYGWNGASWTQQVKLDGLMTTDNYGAAVCLDGDYAMIGASKYDPAGLNDAGGIFIYHWVDPDWTGPISFSGEAAGDYFGCGVGISGDYVVAGAYGDDDNGADAGSAYVFYNNGGWSQQANLTAGASVGSDSLGCAAATSGNYSIVGAYADDGKGSALIYYWNSSTWVQLYKLTAIDGARDDYFGKAVGISGNFAIVGAPEDDDMGTGSGSAYIFQWNGSTWAQQTKLIPDVTCFARFGQVVAISGNYAIVGAPRYSAMAGIDSGGAFIFYWNGSSWIQQVKIVGSDTSGFDFFGSAVAIDGDYAVVGAPQNGMGSSGPGKAYVFACNGSSWTEQAILTAEDGAVGDWFGCSVGISGNQVVIGASKDDDNGADSGNCFVFSREDVSWTQRAKLNPGILDSAAGDQFGYAACIAGDYLAIGSPYNDDKGADSGSVYIYWQTGSSWMFAQKITAGDGVAGDALGCSVGISEYFMVSGASGDDDQGTNSGSSYVYSR